MKTKLPSKQALDRTEEFAMWYKGFSMIEITPHNLESIQDKMDEFINQLEVTL